MQEEFFAKHVSASDEDWGRLVAFGAIEEAGNQPYVMFQGSYEHTEQDIRLGQDKPYIEICDQGWSWYGHMESVVLERKRLVVQMDKVAQAQMQNNGHFVVRFELDEQRFSQLSRKLQQILKGFEGYRENAA